MRRRREVWGYTRGIQERVHKLYVSGLFLNLQLEYVL